MNGKEFLTALNNIVKEKNIDPEVVYDAMELALMTLAEVTTTEIHKTNDSYGFVELKQDAKDGGEIASITRKNIEKKIGKSVLTSENSNTLKHKRFIKAPNTTKKS